MIKPKKGFVMAQLDIEKLTPMQWDGVMRAMDSYANHYHECKSREGETSIAFANWIRDNTIADGAPKVMLRRNQVRYTTNDLFEIFISEHPINQ